MQPKVNNGNGNAADLPGGKMLKFGHMDQLNRGMAQEHIEQFGPIVRNQDASRQPLAVQPVDLDAWRQGGGFPPSSPWHRRQDNQR